MQFLQVLIILIAFCKKNLTIISKKRMMLNNNDTCEEGDKYCKKAGCRERGQVRAPHRAFAGITLWSINLNPHKLGNREDDWGRVKPAGA